MHIFTEVFTILSLSLCLLLSSPPLSSPLHSPFPLQRLFSKDLGARIRELQSGHSVSISDVTVSSEGRARYLECDEVCAQEERNRNLAAALEIDNPNLSPVDSEIQYSSYLLEQARYYMYTCTSLLSRLPDFFLTYVRKRGGLVSNIM